MRILISVDPEIPVPPVSYGGIERIVDQLVSGLRRTGNSVALVANAESTCESEAIFPWPAGSSRGFLPIVRNMVALARAVRKFRPDIVHSFSRLWYLAPLLAASLPKIMSYQRLPTSATVRRAAAVSRGTLVFTGCSEFICAQGRSAGGMWHSIPNFVDLNTFTFRASVPEDAPLVFLSRVERIKGAHTAIAVARRARRRLVIAGNHSANTVEAQYWKREIEPELGHDGIEYIGPVDDRGKNALLGGASALLVPIEWNEPFGIVFAEALACGTPVISCPRGAVPEIVRSGVEGYLASSVAGLADAVAKVAAIDRAGCRDRVEEMFSADHVIGRYEELYAAQVSGASSGSPPEQGGVVQAASGRRP